MPAIQELRELRQSRLLQLLTLTLLFGLLARLSLKSKLTVLDLDNWWHLKVGDWMIEHHAVPHMGLFTWTAADRPWAAYSWGYELLLSRAYAWFGLVGMALYGTLLTLLVAYAVYGMTRRLSGRFWPACLVALVSCSAFLFKVMPRPVFFSMMLFAVTLTLLLEAKRSSRVQYLYWLPLIFLLWANLHIQFIYGLFTVGLLVAVNVAEQLAAKLGWQPAWIEPPSLPFATLFAVFAACFVATCIGPYSFHLYGIILQYAQAKVPYRIIVELRPLHFRVPAHYVQLLLTGFAFLAVGRQKRVDVFKVLLLAVASVVSFRTMRDAWFICIVAAACIADSRSEEREAEPGETWLQTAAVAAGAIVLMLLFARGTDFNTRGLDAAISNVLPVNAANYLREHPALGPLYNTFDWGGFLIWYMPNYPVAIDGRTDLYGDEFNEQAFDTRNGAASYSSDPYLNRAGVVMLENTDNLVNVLQADPRFQRVYHDSLATIFIRGTQ